MDGFRFSPIRDESRLTEALFHIHVSCHRLCKQSLDMYLPVAGNIGIFSHEEKEYERLKVLQMELVDPSKCVYGKYFLLHEPITFPNVENIPGATYTHLYIRKPDDKKPQVGDLDFYLPPEQYAVLKQSVQKGEVPGASLLNRPDLDLVELYNENIDALGYIGDKNWQKSA
jgi:hypothetical protein